MAEPAVGERRFWKRKSLIPVPPPNSLQNFPRFELQLNRDHAECLPRRLPARDPPFVLRLSFTFAFSLPTWLGRWFLLALLF